MNDILVVDNIINRELQDKIKNIMLGTKFPWFFLRDMSHPDVGNEHNYNTPKDISEYTLTKTRPCSKHMFLENGKVVSPYYKDLLPIMNNSAEYIKKNVVHIEQIRAFLQYPLSEKVYEVDKIDPPHIDIHIPHTVFLYYVCDGDGNTVFYDYVSKSKDDKPYMKNLKVIKELEPIQGRVVIFNGLRWHSPGFPKKNVRSILNFDVQCK